MHPLQVGRYSCGLFYLSGLREGDHHFVKRMFDLSFKRVITFFQNPSLSDGGEFPMRQHRGSIASIDIKFLLSSFDFFSDSFIVLICFIGKVDLLQLKLTLQQRLRVGNSPPLRHTMFFNIIFGAFGTYFMREITAGRSPSLKPER